MNTFARETGGKSFFPVSLVNILASSKTSRRRSAISIPSLTILQPGQGRKFRKIKVELVNPENGEELRIVDEKHKPIKYSVIAKVVTPRHAKLNSELGAHLSLVVKLSICFFPSW